MILDLIKLVSDFAKSYESGKAKLFNSHVEILKTKIDEIHADYVKSFVNVRTSLEQKEVPISEMLDFLEARRHDLAAQRDLVQHLATELRNADSRVVTPTTWTAFENFCGAIVNYFNAGNSIANASWYSDFIRFMQISRMASLEAKFFETNVFGNDPRRDVIEKISLILEHRLPAALSEVNKYYAELRSALL
jgi:hypothetical protein